MRINDTAHLCGYFSNKSSDAFDPMALQPDFWNPVLYTQQELQDAKNFYYPEFAEFMMNEVNVYTHQYAKELKVKFRDGREHAIQLDEIKRGNISDAELEAARESIENDCRAAEDHPSDYEDFARIERLFGGPRTIEEYRRGVLSVTREQIAQAASRLTLDTVYFLKGTLTDAEEDDYE